MQNGVKGIESLLVIIVLKKKLWKNKKLKKHLSISHYLGID
jgi:hypothetical protein